MSDVNERPEPGMVFGGNLVMFLLILTIEAAHCAMYGEWHRNSPSELWGKMFSEDENVA